jgi:hypothetical protein
LNPIDEGTIYSLYDDADLRFFIDSRKNCRNHKLFVFRDWENLVYRLHQTKSRNLAMLDLPSFDPQKHTVNFKREIAMFVFWVQYLIQKNP